MHGDEDDADELGGQEEDTNDYENNFDDDEEELEKIGHRIFVWGE